MRRSVRRDRPNGAVEMTLLPLILSLGTQGKVSLCGVIKKRKKWSWRLSGKKGERACVTDLFGNEKGNTHGSGDVGGGVHRGWGNEEMRQTTWHRLHRFCFGERKLWSDAKGNLFLNVKFHTSSSAAPARGSLKWQHGDWLVVTFIRNLETVVYSHFDTFYSSSLKLRTAATW